MTLSDFVNEFVSYFAIDCENKTNQLRIKYLIKWLENKSELDIFFEAVVNNYTPTSINPYPTLQQLNEIYESLNILPEHIKLMKAGKI